MNLDKIGWMKKKTILFKEGLIRWACKDGTFTTLDLDLDSSRSIPAIDYIIYIIILRHLF